MKITFLGHQGWQFENNKGHSFLLDPILQDIGNGVDRLPVWPQRRLDFARMAPIDAVIISHEHADHFSLETLLALPSRCKVYISDLASLAMATAIREMGFAVERFTALTTFAINGLKVTALPALYNRLEPDVYALLVQDNSGASFLTAIDTVAHPDIFAWLAHNCPRRTLDNLTNNFVEPRQPLVSDLLAHTKSRAVVVGNMLEFVQKFQPRRAVVSGQGWCFRDRHTKFNHSYFSVDNSWLTQAARDLAPQVEWFQGVPGMRFELKGDEAIMDTARVLTMHDSADRSFNPESVREAEPFAPWTGVMALDATRLEQVCRFVRENYAQILGIYSPKVIEGLYYLKFQACDELQPTLNVVVRNGDQKLIFEFDYGLLLFTDVTTTADRLGVVGFEIWAADLELLIDAREESFLIYESSVRTWSYIPTFVDAPGLVECFMWFTPRFRPKETLAFYRQQIALLRQK
jgi:hypothetical protein